MANYYGTGDKIAFSKETAFGDGTTPASLLPTEEEGLTHTPTEVLDEAVTAQSWPYPELKHIGWRHQVQLPQIRVTSENAEDLLDMALKRTSGKLDSYCFGRTTSDQGNQKWTGCMVQTAEIASDPGGNLRLSLNMVARAEAALSAAITGSAASFQIGTTFPAATFYCSVNTVDMEKVEQAGLSINNNLAEAPLGPPDADGDDPVIIRPDEGMPDNRLTITRRKEDNTLPVLLAAGTVVDLTFGWKNATHQIEFTGTGRVLEAPRQKDVQTQRIKEQSVIKMMSDLAYAVTAL